MRINKFPEHRPSLLLFATLILMWLLLWGEISIANIVGGIGIALLIVIVAPMPRIPTQALNINWWAMIHLFASWTIDFVTASLTVAWLAIRRKAPPQSDYLTVPLRTNDDLTLASAVALINLQPGGLVVDIDREQQTLLMHILDSSSQKQLDRTRAQLIRMERRIIRAFENRDVEEQQREEQA